MAVLQLNEKTSTVTLANIADTVCGVIEHIAGNEIGNSIDGEPASNDLIRTLVFQRVGMMVSKAE